MSQTLSQDFPEILTVRQAAEILNISRFTLYRNTLIPRIRKPGLGVRFFKSDLLEWLRS
jgi:excisionase family DNA binding protein